MTPKESLALITSVIDDARHRQEENGVMYIYWGLMVAAVSFAHFVLWQLEAPQWIGVVYLALPVAGIGSYFLFHAKRRGRSKNVVATLIRNLWITVGLNMSFLGFILWDQLGAQLIPVILLLLSVSLSVSGAALSSRVLFIAGIGANVAALAGFWLPYAYQPLLLTVVNLLAVALPGALLFQSHRKRNHV
jgi:hypothetical protein